MEIVYRIAWMQPVFFYRFFQALKVCGGALSRAHAIRYAMPVLVLLVAVPFDSWSRIDVR